MIDKSTRPIPTIHALVASQEALHEAWSDDTAKYQLTSPHTSQRTLQAWWQYLSAMWTEEMEAGR